MKSVRPVMKYLHSNITSLNSSKYFAGIVIIVLNVASRYATLDLTKAQEKYLKTGLARELLVFSISWMGTRDIYISIMLTASFMILANYAFNEESRFCVMPHSFKKLSMVLDTDGDGEVSEEELENAMKILERSKKQKKRAVQAEFFSNVASGDTVGAM